jgi:hypothetical protein
MTAAFAIADIDTAEVASSATVRVTLHDGTILEAAAVPARDPVDPIEQAAVVERKFMTLAVARLGFARADRLRQHAAAIGTISDLFGLVRLSPGSGERVAGRMSATDG